MQSFGQSIDIAIVAGEDLSLAAVQYRAVGVDGLLADNPAQAFGVLQSKGASGASVRVAIMGHVKMLSGGAINSGSRVTVAASGFFTAYTAAASGAQPTVVVGKTLQQVASGDLFDAIVNFSNAGLG